MTKDTIIVNYEIFGPITVNDFLYYIDYLIKQNNDNQDILHSLLNNAELDESDKISILNKFDLSYTLNFIKDIFND